MSEALTDALLRADFAEMTDDLTVTVIYAGETVIGTKDVMDADPVLDYNGFLNDARFPVWVPLGGTDGLTVTPRVSKTISVDGTTYQILATTDDDGVCIRLFLGDITAG